MRLWPGNRMSFKCHHHRKRARPAERSAEAAWTWSGWSGSWPWWCARPRPPPRRSWWPRFWRWRRLDRVFLNVAMREKKEEATISQHLLVIWRWKLQWQNRATAPISHEKRPFSCRHQDPPTKPPLPRGRSASTTAWPPSSAAPSRESARRRPPNREEGARGAIQYT